MMFFVKTKSCVDGHTESGIYRCEHIEMVDSVRKAKSIFLFVLPFRIVGKTYNERKDSLRNIAIDFQYENDGETDYQLSMEKIGLVEDFFERMGRKYGLLREFRQNAIC